MKKTKKTKEVTTIAKKPDFSANKVNVATYPVYEMDTKGKLIIPSDIISQITYLHSSIGKTEWSGILLYDVISGNPSEPSEFVLKAKHIFLMDIGNSIYTEYETDGDIVDIYDNIEEAMNLKIGHIHTHHNESAFFSGTDMNELMQNVDKHNYYLSFVVNFSGNYIAKVAFLSEKQTTSWMSFVDDHGQPKKFKKETSEKIMVVINMDIHLEYNNKFFYERIAKVKDKKKEKEKMLISARKDVKRWNTYQQSLYDTDYHDIGHYDADYHDSGYYRKIYGDRTRYGKPSAINMSMSEVESLTKSILTGSKQESVSSTVYQILCDVAEGNKNEIEFYYDLLVDNIENVLSDFFGTDSFKKSDLEIVLKKVIAFIQKYEFHKDLKVIVSEIIERLNVFCEEYESEIDIYNK